MPKIKILTHNTGETRFPLSAIPDELITIESDIIPQIGSWFDHPKLVNILKGRFVRHISYYYKGKGEIDYVCVYIGDRDESFISNVHTDTKREKAIKEAMDIAINYYTDQHNRSNLQTYKSTLLKKITLLNEVKKQRFSMVFPK